jgi:RNA polymerase sigma-B factor
MSDEAPRRPGEDAAFERFAEYRRTGDRGVRNELVERYAGIAESVARRYRYRGEPLDDLRQVALVGLLKAVERFDPSRGLQFSTFAVPTIAGELKRHFRDKGWAVRVPRHLQELQLELDRTSAALAQERGRPPTPAELAERAGVREEDVLESMEAGGLYRLASLDGRLADDETPSETPIAADDPELDAVEDRVAVEPLLRSLAPRDQAVVYLRFYEGLTQSEIAARLGISQMHVSRLLGRSLESLRDRSRTLAEREPEASP